MPDLLRHDVLPVDERTHTSLLIGDAISDGRRGNDTKEHHP